MSNTTTEQAILRCARIAAGHEQDDDAYAFVSELVPLPAYNSPAYGPETLPVGAAEAMLRAEEAQAVKAAVDALPEQQRLAVILSRFDGLSYDEIAGVMGCSSKAVKSLLHRAREGLKVQLEKYFRK